MGLAATYLKQSGTLATKTGNDADGDPTYAAATAVVLRLVDTVTTRFGVNGPVTIADARIYVDAATTVAQQDRFVVNGVTYQVVEVQTLRGVAGSADHKRCLVRQEAV